MKYTQWDFENETATGVISNCPKGPDWYPMADVPKRESRAQNLVWSLVDGVVHGDWVGSDDPNDEPAPAAEIQRVWKLIMQLPIAADDGKVFQVDRDSRDIMAVTIAGLAALGGTVDWRLDDNSTVTCDAADLQAYFDQLLVNMAARGLAVDAEYVAFKSSGATVGQLKAWLHAYLP